MSATVDGLDELDDLEVPTTDEGRDALRSFVLERKVIVVVGSGGVGKTTSAAALAVFGASVGRRSLVITIDPARRLANALGLEGLSHEPQRVDDTVMRAAGLPAKAPLHAMMLDVKAAWDDMLRRTAPDVATVDEIRANRFYEVLSRELPGAHEFIACECLQHLTSSGRFDLIVLDTPPTQNALDFLDAPERILGVLDNDAFRYFAQKSQSLGLRFLDGAAGRAQSVLARFTGPEILEEMGDFVVLLRDLYDPLMVRARDFVALLEGRDTRFVIVTSPQPSALSEARFFLAELTSRGLPLGALVVNRITSRPKRALAVLGNDAWEEELSDLPEPQQASLAAVLDTAVRQQAQLSETDDNSVATLLGENHGVAVVRVPRLSEAVHDARRLGELVPWLVGPAR